MRVLHPLIPATKEVEIMRGLPEGSRLSPILFAMLAADLIRDLRTQFPDVTMPSVSVLVWIGTIFYVDDAIIIARSPSQLQAMLNQCQQWAEKNRLSINVNKTKVMVFFENPTVRAARQRFRFTLSPSFPTPLDPKTHILTKIAQRYRRHTALQPAEFAVVPPNTLGVVESTDMSGLSVVDFPTIGRVEIRKADLGHISLVPVEVDEFKYLGLILDHLLTMDAAATAGVKQIEFAHSKLAATLHSLRQLPRRQTHSALSPAMRLQMWRSCVHTHALENIRYLRTKGQIQRWQSAVSLSLKKSFLHFEQPLPMSLDLGVPPLDLVQALQLVKLHFRYSYDSPSTMQAHLYSLQRQWKQKFSTDAIVNRIEQAFDTLSLTSQYPSLQQVPLSVSDPNTKQKEKAYGNFLKKQVSEVWRASVLRTSPLLSPSQTPDTRLAAYVQLAYADLSRNLFTPAPYLRCFSVESAFYLFRMRTQDHLTVPTQNPRPNGVRQTEYNQRQCPLCPRGQLGNEAHYYFVCPSTTALAQTLISIVRARLPWASYSQHQRLAVLLGTLPHTLKVKDHKEWILGVLPICHQVATQITRCIDKSVHTTAQSMHMTGDQLRAVFSQPLATVGGLPLHVPAPVSSDSEEED